MVCSGSSVRITEIYGDGESQREETEREGKERAVLTRGRSRQVSLSGYSRGTGSAFRQPACLDGF